MSPRTTARRPGLTLACAGAVLAVPFLAACTTNTPAGSAAPAGDTRALTVTATDTACTVSSATAPAGKLTFSVTNAGTKVNEFYLLGSDGLRVVGEVENIGPGLSRDLVVTAIPGTYIATCKPGMTGDGIRSDLTVEPSGEATAPTGNDAELIAQANQGYEAYVKEQAEQLVTGTQAFVAAYKAGDAATARTLYPKARTHWERIETVAESFGDLDPKMDAREADLEPGQKWTGWHRMEKDLWPARATGYTALTAAQRATYADDLMANTRTLEKRVSALTFTTDQIANGSIALLDEVAKGKVTGEEEYWSRTDLWDFQANVDGARVAFEGLRPLLKQKDAALDKQIDARFTALQALLDEQRSGSGFRSYDKVSTTDIRGLVTAVDALAEPLSKLSATVV
ncbi:MAG: peptidase family protein [Friedmanniella sp.]|nr:peptidase family protein [Friedmanniella sp.]